MNPERLGPYQIVRLLGRGGMGAVFEGLNSETGEPVAVKSLAPGLAREEDFRLRFEVEIETLRKLRHPNIVRLYAFGEQDSQLFYAMELVKGQSLEDELRRGRRFDWREVTVIGIQICRALRHAHDRGIIHRDIKPANLLLTDEGEVKLSDFGIARLFGNTRLTAAGNVLGSVEYMAPEQADARPVGPRADLYSLGGVLYALLAGRAPFKARSIPEMLDLQRSAKPDPVSRYAFAVPEELERIIAELLEKDPEKRVANAMILGRRLEAMLHGLSLTGGTRKGQKTVSGDFDTDADPRDPGRTDVLGTPPTRTLGKGSEPPSYSFRIATPGEELPETRQTSAFQAFDPQTDRGGVAEAEPTRQSDRFVVVPEEELDRHEAAELHPPLVSIQTWVLAAALVVVGLVVWYFLRPPSADRLYDRVAAQTDDRSIESLRAARGDIDEFLTRYSDDPRAGKLREYAAELELSDLERAFDIRAMGLASRGELLPIERAYQEAINYARLDPDQGIVKLRALVDLYDHRSDTTGPTGKCLELARRRLKRLEEQLKEPTENHLDMLTDRLNRADQLRDSDPQQARKMWKAVIELYAAKPWAADAVRRAREALAAHPEAAGDAKPQARQPKPGTSTTQPDKARATGQAAAEPQTPTDRKRP